jgi:hypothetical protein
MSVPLRDSRFPVGRLLLRVLADSGLRPGAFMRALGYENINTGMAAFDRWVSTGAGATDILTRLQLSPFAVPGAELDGALEESAAMLHAGEARRAAEADAWARAHFRPHVWAVLDRPLGSWGRAAMFYSGPRYNRTLPVGLHAWDDSRQQAVIRETILELHAAPRTSTIDLGTVIGYRVFLAYGEPAVDYTVEGVPMPAEAPPEEQPSRGDA